MSSERRILQLDAGQASVHLWRRGELLCEASFPADAAGAATFAAHVARRPDSHYTVVADVNEEGFQVDTIPYVHGKSRSALLQRKLAQAFYGSPLTLALSLGREMNGKGTGRRDERVLMLGLTHGDFFKPWLSALRQAKATLSGLYSTAQLSGVLARRHLHEAEPHFILITLGRAGIRLCFFEAGRLRFSHLGPAADSFGEGGLDALAAACARESARLLTYLHGQRLVPRDEALPCLILAHPEQHATFAAHCQSTPELDFRFLDLLAVSRGAGLVALPTNSSAETLLLHLAASQAPAEQFAPDAERHLYRLWMARRWLLAGTGVILGLCLLLAGAESWLALSAQSRAAQLHAEARTLSAEYRARLDALPPLATLPENLRTLAASYRALEIRSAWPDDSYILLSRVLDGFPEVSLKKLEWSVSGNEDGSEARRTPGSSDFHVVLTLHATLPPETGLRQQLAIVEAFSAALARDPALHVVTLERPLNMEPGKLLRGSGDRGEETAKPQFSLRLSRRL
ncbi:MAG: hypothetical protein PHU46_09995 [Rhodocyclaceae bacterium]|nr:hypothetical protein [Rhodocyclaceae bacterium]